MKKLRPLACYALVTAVMTFGAGSVLAEPATDQDTDYEPKSTQHDKDAKHSSSKTMPSATTTPGAKSTSAAKTGPSDQSAQRAKDAYAKTPAADRYTADTSREQNRGYIDAAPANGMQASELIGTEVKTTNGEDVGPVEDLIIDEDGQVVAIVIGVGGFLDIGDKDVAIGWDDVTRSGTSDERELTINMTRDDLRPAPEFAKQD